MVASCNFPFPPQRHLADALVAAETQAEAGGRRARRRLDGGRPGRRHSCLPFAEVPCKECIMIDCFLKIFKFSLDEFTYALAAIFVMLYESYPS